MDSINLMVEEHTYIKRMLIVVRNASINILNGGKIDYDDFYKMIDFIRNYADKHHHGKEENMLFNKMVDELGNPIEKVINMGMLVEHNQGRSFIYDLEEALKRVKNGDDDSKVDVIANAVSYENLLKRHIEKEDSTVYTFASKNLSRETLDKINSECEKFEEIESKNKVQEKYIKLLEDLEKKYI
ncbi:hemerythrin-like domain-containing protein [Clostridium acetobutylicum]|uniref:Uncharacterized conserved protein, YTFE family n=1 Tax=Clostridium acetobutylicum (strain ATCC 824 / DSM 792 / JCM 1419 / IAM 19013 / LMG 5710 / NBRC 13948 / NRRL B-527 / VKM B-1787 / 2291 / W) TaxID=272562 RepID=Q97G81_CLOAB|nr:MULTISPECIES: hemerythrin domain-containing protein [Clostridium]AAK80442.1 Uncharacterized conserved protein, YTFE family [Clostridium acetobutylicum ATCC 824]ADZ21539.1 Conserved hypothetical protein [Clostridium acetobutylicum EA 2018]AEI32380.1 hypothetical protein SMB_G2523 [Clostridium acetobutylicum DSM 1731]AWV79141.1 hemerythrin domain-containing protein [Clostridium acetobutylicum]MBC2394896.1 hemerythrin domain-containing protein [Clostridium acetobutylicum]